MSVNDPVKIMYNEKRGKWQAFQGRESFFDCDRYQLEWDSSPEAVKHILLLGLSVPVMVQTGDDEWNQVFPI